jgi:hypothetical protein
LAKPLYEATKWGEWEPMAWGEEQEKACKEIKRALTIPPCSGPARYDKALLLMRDWEL